MKDAGSTGRASLTRWEHQPVDALARRILAVLVEEIPFYTHLPTEELQGEILRICRHNVRSFMRSVSTGGTPRPSDVDEIRASAARRAEERVPLGAVLAAYQRGAALVWEEVASQAGEDLSAVAGAALRYLGIVTGAVSEAYLEEWGAIAGQQREARRALTEALLSGSEDRPAVSNASLVSLAAVAGHRLASSYWVVCLDVGRLPGPARQSDGDEIRTLVEARRRQRRLEAELDLWSRGRALWSLGLHGGVILVPAGDELIQMPEVEMGVLVEKFNQAAGLPVTAAAAMSRDTSGGARAFAEAQAVLDLVIALGRPAGLYRVEDVLFEYALSRDRSAANRLASVLAPLTDHPELVRTLRAYLELGRSRQRASRELGVHPNTVDYRLRRICELSGFDPHQGSDSAVLLAALAMGPVCAALSPSRPGGTTPNPARPQTMVRGPG